MPPEALRFRRHFRALPTPWTVTAQHTVNPHVLGLGDSRKMGELDEVMLKEVMLGAGGILLAAAIFASSVTPGSAPGEASGVPAPLPTAAPVAQPSPAPASSQPAPVFEVDNGDTVFGAPMVSAKPLATSGAEPPPIVTDPDSAVANGGRQFYAKPGRPFPTPE